MSFDLSLTIKAAPELLAVLQRISEAFTPKTVTLPQSPTEQATRQRMVQTPAPVPMPQQAAPTYAPVPAVPVVSQQYPPMQQAPVNPTPTAPIQAPVVQPAMNAGSSTAQPAAVPSNPAPVATAPAYTMDDLARAASALMDAGKQQQLVGLLGQFGVQALTQLPKERYGEFATALRGLGARI